jgi:hypothetical protein
MSVKERKKIELNPSQMDPSAADHDPVAQGVDLDRPFTAIRRADFGHRFV